MIHHKQHLKAWLQWKLQVIGASKKRGMEELQLTQILQVNLLLPSFCMDRKYTLWFIYSAFVSKQEWSWSLVRLWSVLSAYWWLWQGRSIHSQSRHLSMLQRDNCRVADTSVTVDLSWTSHNHQKYIFSDIMYLCSFSKHTATIFYFSFTKCWLCITYKT